MDMLLPKFPYLSFAPLYFLRTWAEYAQKTNKNYFTYPIKITMVLDQRTKVLLVLKKALYDENGNLILEGEKSKIELGFLLTGFINEILKNITLENRLSLYSDYINKFGNIDIDYDLTLELVVNEYVKTNIGLHIIYDDDIKG
jgi:hypothetical protein